MLYDVNGNPILNSEASDFSNNMELDYAYDSATGANYSVIRVFKIKRDGTRQYPFVRCPGFMKASALAADEGWHLVINAGLGWESAIDGVAIQNGTVINGTVADHHAGAVPLTIDANGDFGVADASATGAEIIASNVTEGGIITSGIVSAVCGFCTLVENYEPVVSFPSVSNVTHFTDDAQRQIIGQFGNGDYAIVSCAGRSTQNSDGWTLAEAQTICVKLGLKFAYNLDGGNSVATFLGRKPVWDYLANVSRVVPSFIVFNGSSHYALPETEG